MKVGKLVENLVFLLAFIRELLNYALKRSGK